ncbi:MAG TPA: PA0069 family radical SAM protein [Bacteroidia bacterium]
MQEKDKENYFKGRGSQINPNNRFDKFKVVTEHVEGLDEELLEQHKTELIYTYPKTIINKVDSPDVGAAYSMNPYQGCEHGCIYCYARNTHEYWGYSAGIDFEQKIIVKQNIKATLEKQLSNKNWQPLPIMLSGNTDCYQPAERKLKLTRSILETCLKFKHPVGIISKNTLVTRDIDILQELAKDNLVHVMISITGLTEETRQLLEPRTATYKGRLMTLKKISDAGIPCGVMVAPIIPGLTNHEVANVIEQAALHGATTAGYTIVRLNGAIGEIFKDWLFKNYPDGANKVWNQICECHGGEVNDSRFGTRMRGEGKIAESIRNLFILAKRKHMSHNKSFEFNLEAFDYKAGDNQLRLF